MNCNKKNKIGFLYKKNRSGFTFIEMMMAVSIFSVIMAILTSVFVKTIDTRKRTEAIQKNMEDARVVIESITKTLRTSTLVSCNNDTSISGACANGNPVSLEFFDNSQSKCIQYKFDGGPIYKMKVRTVGMNGNGGCIFPSYSDPNPSFVSMVGENNFIKNVSFRVLLASATPIGSATVGKVSISMEVCSDYNHQGCTPKSDSFPIQTTVSIRK
jgi:prepilin-type N-terminal cleavage/methylation domain-containing protein